MQRSIVLALAAVVGLLTGCNQPAVTPKAPAFQSSENTVRDWNDVAQHIAAQMATLGLLPTSAALGPVNAPPPRPIFVRAQAPNSAFLRAVADALEAAIMHSGGTVARAPAGATVVNLDVSFVRWGPRDKPPGLGGTTAGILAIPGIVVGASVPMSTWTAANAAGFTAVGLGALIDAIVSLTPTMNAEAIWAATIVTDDRVIMRTPGAAPYPGVRYPTIRQGHDAQPRRLMGRQRSTACTRHPLRSIDERASIMYAVFRCLAIGLLIGPTVVGCGGDPNIPATSSDTIGAQPYGHADLGTLTYRAVDLMLAGAPEVGVSAPLVVASIADVRNLESTSALGNIVADMIRSRLVQDGRVTTEIRLRGAVGFNKGTGEFMLSRNRRALMPPSTAAGIVAGTYATGFQNVYVSLKLMSATDARIISAADFTVPLLDVVGLLPRIGSP